MKSNGGNISDGEPCQLQGSFGMGQSGEGDVKFAYVLTLLREVKGAAIGCMDLPSGARGDQSF